MCPLLRPPTRSTLAWRMKMSPWNVTIRVHQYRTMLLVADPRGDVLKAQMPTQPEHPRALVTLLEGLGRSRTQPRWPTPMASG